MTSIVKAVGAPTALRRTASLAFPLRRACSTVRPTASASHAPAAGFIVASACVLLSGALVFSQRSRLLNEASKSSQHTPERWSDGATTNWRQQSQLHRGEQSKGVFLWGSNRNNVVAPGEEGEVVKKPRAVPFFQGAVLRDLALHEIYAVAVDAKGDVYQWGDGFSSSPCANQCRLTLHGLDIQRVACTPSKVYALSRSGKVYVFSASASLQQHVASPSADRVQASWLPTWLGGRPYPGIDAAELKTLETLQRGERVSAISAGTDHLLALTSKGRLLATPVTRNANTHGQLGVKHVVLEGGEKDTLNPNALDGFEELVKGPRWDPANLPRAMAWLDRDGSRGALADALKAEKPASTLPPESAVDDGSGSIRFSTILHEVPSLRGLTMSHIAVGARHTLVQTSEGRALGFGANTYGQLGAGPSMAFPALLAPTEVDWSRAYPGKKEQIKCVSVAAGGDSSYWVVERTEGKTGKRAVDVLAAGHGQFGGIGNGQWSHQGSPVRVKSISGLLEWSEEAGAIEPISIHGISAGNTHVGAVLDNAVAQPGAVFGRDVFLWGHNADWQLGTGKRANLAVPQHLPPLPYPPATAAPTAAGEIAKIGSGTDSPMPHDRLQLSPKMRSGKMMVEETLVVGYGTTGVYWRIVD